MTTTFEFKCTRTERNIEDVIVKKLVDESDLDTLFGLVISLLQQVGVSEDSLGRYFIELAKKVLGSTKAVIPLDQEDHSELCKIEELVQDSKALADFIEYVQDCDPEDADDIKFFKDLFGAYIEAYGAFGEDDDDDEDEPEIDNV